MHKQKEGKISCNNSLDNSILKTAANTSVLKTTLDTNQSL